jgi:Zn-dependent protease with chaperone function
MMTYVTPRQAAVGLLPGGKVMRRVLLALGVLVLLHPGLGAQQPEPPSQNPKPPDRPDNVPMPRPPRSQESSFGGALVVADEDLQDEGTGPVPVPEPSEQAVAYYHSGNILWLVETAWGILIPCLFLFTGLSARMQTWARRLGHWWFFAIAVYFLIFSILTYLLDFPLDYYRGYVRQHAYGLSNQTFGKWFGDSLIRLAIQIIAGCLFLWVPYLLLKKSPQRWWLYTAILAVPFLFFVVLVVPIWVEPLFNQFGPMKNKALEAEILALADRAGIEGSRIYEVNKSEDTKAVNAYVTGFGNTKRIVLWDTLLAKLSAREVLFVMGHEMGHYVLGHNWQGIAFFALLILVTLYVAHRTLGVLLGRFKDRFGFDQLADIASVPLFILLINVFALVVLPVGLAFSRHIEHEADRFGLEITRDNRAAAMAFVKLQRENLGVPRPGLLYKLWRESHPPIGERIDFCNEYRPWEKGEPLVYGHLFRTKK